MIRIWRGHHGPEFANLLASSWEEDGLLIVCPPSFDCSPSPRARERFRFLNALPKGPIRLEGDWREDERQRLEAWIAEAASIRPRPIAASERPVLGVFTSGTGSGRPRCVLYSKANVSSSVRAILSVFEPGRIRSVFCYPQPFHCFGLVLGYCLPLLHSLERIAPPGRYGPESHGLWLKTVGDGTLTLGTPTHFHDLLGHAARERERGAGRPGPSYSAIVGGARVSRDLWLRIREELAIEMPSIGYGATEAAPGVLHHPPGREPIEDGEIGFVLPEVRVELRPGKGLEFDGPNRCLAVIDEGTTSFPRRILLSDDVRRREDGMHVCHGRTELILNRGGRKFALEAMEEAIRRELSLEVLCVGLPDPRLGEELGILLRTSARCEQARERIFALLRNIFHSRFDPTRFTTVDDFPVNENFKPDRRAGALLLERGTGP